MDIQMICRIKKYVEIIKSGRVSVPDELAIEHLIRNGCGYLGELEALYNKYCRRREQLVRDVQDPSPQEESRKRFNSDT